MSESRSRRFRTEREASWLRLEALLTRLERGSMRRLSDEELLSIPALYRATLSALSVARATSLDRGLVEYLESLSMRAYFLVYGTRTGLGRRLAAFFARDWPLAAQALWRETLAGWAVLLAGAVLAALLVHGDPGWFSAFVGDDMAGGRDPSASTARLRDTLYTGDGHAAFAAYLFTNNAQVAIGAFALGFAFCLPTAALLAYNGMMLGAFFVLFAEHGLGVGLGGWLAVHGVTEVSAVVLAGAAGFRIGTAVAMPGQQSRIDAAAVAGRQAATLMVGVFVMLFCAGLLEGIVRQVVTGDRERYAIGGLTALFWAAYLYLPRPRHG